MTAKTFFTVYLPKIDIKFWKREVFKGVSTLCLKSYKILCSARVCALLCSQDTPLYDSQLQVPL